MPVRSYITRVYRIKAIQWDGTNTEEVVKFYDGDSDFRTSIHDTFLHIKNKDGIGERVIEIGQFLVDYQDGTFGVVSQHDFNNWYVLDSNRNI